MSRGRKRIPDEVHAMKGNPSKRRLQLAPKEDAAATVSTTEGVRASPPKAEVPGFLTAKREIAIFRRVVEDFVQQRIARSPDLSAYGRWAYYTHRWCLLKEGLEKKKFTYETKSKHGKLLRKHPDFVAMLDLERILQSLEDRLGLNPVARQNYLRGLSALPPALADLFAHDESAKVPGDKADPASGAPPPVAASPLNFLHSGQGGPKPS